MITSETKKIVREYYKSVPIMKDKFNKIKMDEHLIANFDYDAPIRLVMQQTNSELEEQLKDKIYKVINKYGISINEEALHQALQKDALRYKEAFRKGYEEGYQQALKDNE